MGINVLETAKSYYEDTAKICGYVDGESVLKKRIIKTTTFYYVFSNESVRKTIQKNINDFFDEVIQLDEEASHIDISDMVDEYMGFPDLFKDEDDVLRPEEAMAAIYSMFKLFMFGIVSKDCELKATPAVLYLFSYVSWMDSMIRSLGFNPVMKGVKLSYPPYDEIEEAFMRERPTGPGYITIKGIENNASLRKLQKLFVDCIRSGKVKKWGQGEVEDKEDELVTDITNKLKELEKLLNNI